MTAFLNAFPQLPQANSPPSKVLPLKLQMYWMSFEERFCLFLKAMPTLVSLAQPECGIELIPVEPVRYGKIHTILNQNKYLDKYLNLPFNFRCCIKFPWPSVEYQTLKKITVKVHYPLPLVPAVLEQLCGSSILTKLDL